MARRPAWFHPDVPLLNDRCPLPLDRPFTSAQAQQLGVRHACLRDLVASGLVREVVRGAYVAAQVQDTLACRADALRLVVAPSAVVTDRTAAWLHGVDVLPRSAVHEMPPLDVDSRTGSRVRRPGVDGGIRELARSDVTSVDGVAVTTKLRTALDLGRLLPRYDAIGALDAFLAAGVPRHELSQELGRFAGHRGVVQLRELVPLADRRAESMPESALRLHFHDAELPSPEPQFWVYDEHGVGVYRIDLAIPSLRYAAEFLGERFHTGEAAERDDATRTKFLLDRRWVVDEFWKDDLYAPGADPQARLSDGVARARAAIGSWQPEGHYL